jgi:putative ABC transport system substrate-binding protein
MAQAMAENPKMLLRRRNFLAVTLGLPLLCRGRALAQTTSKPVEIGFAYEGIAPSGAVRAKALQEGLHSRGFEEGRDFTIVVKTAESRQDQFEPIVHELVQRDVKVLFVAGHSIVRMAKKATSTIPIVALDLEADPVKDGLVQSVARPGGNLTGMFFDFPDFAKKWLQLLAEVQPNLHRLAVLWDTSTAEHQVDAVSGEARARNVALQILKAHSPADFEPAFDAATDGKADAMLILSSPLFGTNPKLLAEPAIRHKLPTITFFPEFARVGGLMAYGTNLIDLFSQAGVVIAKILSGETPATLPVERPSRFQLIVNLKTAARIGVTVPTSILLRADEVVE